jgi:protein SCO1/2
MIIQSNLLDKFKKTKHSFFCFFFIFFLTNFFPSTFFYAAESVPPTLIEVGVEEKLGEFLDTNLNFYSSQGEEINFNSFFKDNKSIILSFSYYSCPMLCHLVTDGLSKALSDLTLQIGTNFEVVSVSIDPDDNAETASAFKTKHLKRFNDNDFDRYWTFLYGDEISISSLTKSAGFKYRYNEMTSEFAHSALIMIISPDRKISRYLYGIEFRPLDLKLSILEALNNNLISTVDRVLLFCYNYDPLSRKYVIFAENVMKIGGFLTIVILFSLIYFLRKRYP